MYSLIYIISYILLRVKFSRSSNFKTYIYMYISTYMYMAKPTYNLDSAAAENPFYPVRAMCIKNSPLPKEWGFVFQLGNLAAQLTQWLQWCSPSEHPSWES